MRKLLIGRVFQLKQREWAWRIRDNNDRPIAMSGRTYVGPQYAARALYAFVASCKTSEVAVSMVQSEFPDTEPRAEVPKIHAIRRNKKTEAEVA